jgi:hypothetical protein
MKIPKRCVPNNDDRCISCRGRRISEKRKRVCPLYRLLKKKGPVKLYESFATEMAALRNRIAELEQTVQELSRHLQLN